MVRRLLFIPAKKDIINADDVIINTSHNPTQIYKYDFENNTITYLATLAGISSDVAMTANKLWIRVSYTIYEYNITLNPWSIVLNRSMPSGILSGNGLAVKDENTLLGGTTSLIVADITTDTPVCTRAFYFPDVTYAIAGDLLYKSGTDTYLIIYNHDVIAEISNTGELLKSFSTGIANTLYGLFIKNGITYVVESTGEVYQLNDSTLEITYVKKIPLSGFAVMGAAQAAIS